MFNAFERLGGVRPSSRRRVLLAGAGLVAAALTTPAAAQEQTTAGESVAEVIVTTTRRAEQLIDVPQAVTAITSQTLTRFNIQSFADYGQKIPNLVFNQGQGGGGFSGSRGVTVRGMVGANTTTMYIDDTAIPVSQNPRIVDIERIEVLKGPQGTLFGASAIGGTIRVITRKPSLVEDDFKMMAQGGFTKHGGSADFGANAIGNIVVVPDKIGVRIMGFVNHDSGFVTKRYPFPAGANTIVSKDDEGSTYQYGASVSALWQVTPDFTANFRIMGQAEDMDGAALVYRGVPDFDPTSYIIDRDYNLRESSRNDWFLPSLTLEYATGRVSITSSSSMFYRDSYDEQDISEAMKQVMFNRYRYVFDYPFGGGGPNTTRNYQQEVRATVDILDNLSAIVGGYYSHQTNYNHSIPRVFPGFSRTAAATAARITTDAYYTSDGRTVTKDRSVFGELTYQPIEQVTLTAGIRRYNLVSDTNNLTQGFAVAQNVPTNTINHVVGKGYSPRFSVKFEPDPELTLYASMSKGFRPGGPGAVNASQPTCAPDWARLGITRELVLAGYKSDSVWSYEAGAKKSLMGRRLLIQGAAFRTDWNDIQQRVALPSCGTTFTGNAGAARVQGFELEADGQLAEGFTVRVGIGYTDAKITDDNSGSTGQKVGDSVYGVPKFNGTVGFSYERDLSPSMSGFISGDWSYVGSSVTTNASTTFPERRGSYDIGNVRFGVRKGENEFSVYINNITDTLANYGDFSAPIVESIVIRGNTVPYGRVFISRPRQVGVQYRRGF